MLEADCGTRIRRFDIYRVLPADDTKVYTVLWGLHGIYSRYPRLSGRINNSYDLILEERVNEHMNIGPFEMQSRDL